MEFGGLKAPWYSLSGEKRICRQCPATGPKGPRREPAPSRSLPGLSGASHALLVQSHQPDRPTLVLPLSTQAASEDLGRSWPATPTCPRKRLKSLSGYRRRGAHPDGQRTSAAPGAQVPGAGQPGPGSAGKEGPRAAGPGLKRVSLLLVPYKWEEWGRPVGRTENCQINDIHTQKGKRPPTHPNQPSPHPRMSLSELPSTGGGAGRSKPQLNSTHPEMLGGGRLGSKWIPGVAPPAGRHPSPMG